MTRDVNVITYDVVNSIRSVLPPPRDDLSLAEVRTRLWRLVQDRLRLTMTASEQVEYDRLVKLEAQRRDEENRVVSVEPTDVLRAIQEVAPDGPATVARLSGHLRVSGDEIEDAIVKLVLERRVYAMRSSELWTQADWPEPRWTTSYHLWSDTGP
jgi:hypothetical protein